MFYAHSNPSDPSSWQSLQEHLVNTAQIASKLSEGTSFQEYAWLAGLLHDLGKYSAAFQKRLKGSKIRVDHSTAGAQEVLARFSVDPSGRIKALILAYCIAGHHGGLPDFGDPTDHCEKATLWGRQKRSLENYQAGVQEMGIADLTLPAAIPIRPNPQQIGFSLAFFTRMVYSALVDADFLETETFMNGGRKARGSYPSIHELCEKFNQFIQKFNNPRNPVDARRTRTLQQSIQKAASPPGLFSLTVPTGGGKTLASMAFALNHAARHNLKRIIYVIPFTTIIEQNAAIFKQCLGDEVILEHHSNFDRTPPQTSDENPDDRTNTTLGKLKLATENWDIPIIVTTNVQFFESAFSNRSSHCRKLHNLANSVIIFDEAQVLPREFLQPCMSALDELVRNYGTTVVFCTATQPHLEKFFPAGTKFEELADSPLELYQFYRRVKIHNLGRASDDDLLQKIGLYPQVLCIVNTRRHARGLFSGLPREGRFHLSTLMCPAHRKLTIQMIRDHLLSGKPCRVISTQIMEAGIDVDFPVGFRALAGLDSIIQAGGRVNREAKRLSGELYVFEPDTPLIKRVPAYIQQGADLTQKILRDYEDPISLEAIQAYFLQLYSFHDDKAFDSTGILGCFRFNGLEPALDFSTAAERFKLIQENTTSIIIPYDDQVDRILQDIQLDIFQIPRKLQPYTVNIYQNEFENLQSKGLLDSIGKFYVLNNPDYYDLETGLVLPDQQSTAIFMDGA